MIQTFIIHKTAVAGVEEVVVHLEAAEEAVEEVSGGADEEVVVEVSEVVGAAASVVGAQGEDTEGEVALDTTRTTEQGILNNLRSHLD